MLYEITFASIGIAINEGLEQMPDVSSLVLGANEHATQRRWLGDDGVYLWGLHTSVTDSRSGLKTRDLVAYVTLSMHASCENAAKACDLDPVSIQKIARLVFPDIYFQTPWEIITVAPMTEVGCLTHQYDNSTKRELFNSFIEKEIA
jgi:hypothetical protein